MYTFFHMHWKVISFDKYMVIIYIVTLLLDAQLSALFLCFVIFEMLQIRR